ncbi:Hypothetical predicted protein [Podarcis lilfordi]|uniref:Uncharacterized protein n=1 Tax=Podarcis lilfordi TaxID=74358 RepID=A0AA35P8D7_9SAUR|nr:Hypothetical predicted protein [Podarcis lilfordi]
MQRLRWIWSLISGAFSENKQGNTIIEKQVSWIRTPPPPPALHPDYIQVWGSCLHVRLVNLWSLCAGNLEVFAAWRVCALALSRCGRRQLPRPISARGQAAPLRARLNAAYLPSRGQRLRRGRASIDVGARIPPLPPPPARAFLEQTVARGGVSPARVREEAGEGRREEEDEAVQRPLSRKGGDSF